MDGLINHVLYLVGDGPEGKLNLLAALHVLRLLGDHEGHVLLQGHETIPRTRKFVIMPLLNKINVFITRE